MAGRETPPSVHNCGYSASREQAMTDFKARWLALLTKTHVTPYDRPVSPHRERVEGANIVASLTFISGEPLV
jgi:hypothetical protein